MSVRPTRVGPPSTTVNGTRSTSSSAVPSHNSNRPISNSNPNPNLTGPSRRVNHAEEKKEKKRDNSQGIKSTTNTPATMDSDFTPMPAASFRTTSAVAPNSSSASSSSSSASFPSSTSSSSSSSTSSSSLPSGSLSGRRVAHASNTANAILRGGGNDSDDDDTAGGEGLGERRIDIAAVLREVKLDAAKEKAESLERQREEKGDDQPKAKLAGAPDVEGPPLLPPQADEDNELFYVPRLTHEALERITGQSDLRVVSKLALHLNTEEQELGMLNTLLPGLHELHLIPPSFVSSFRDFGRSLVNIRKLVLPQAGLTDLDGIEFLTKLIELRAPDNRIEDLSPLMFAPALQVLDLSANRIKERDMIEFIGVCTNLKELELDGNPISMCVHYRSIVGSRCTDIAEFKLDGTWISEAERVRHEDSDESLIDKSKLRGWQEKSDRADAAVSAQQAALQRKIATADFNTLTTAPRPHHHASATNSSTTSPTAVSARPSSSGSSSSSSTFNFSRGPSASASLSASGLSSSASSVSSVQRKKDFQAYLDSKEASKGELARSSALKRKQEKSSAIDDIMRLENEMRDEQSSTIAAEYIDKITRQNVAARNVSNGTAPSSSSAGSVSGGVIPRLQFDASVNASGFSPTSSPQQVQAPYSTHSFAAGIAAASVSPTGMMQHYSLSTPRPGSSAGRPGSSSGARVVDEDHSASDLTYGSDSVMAGNYAQAMRARKKQGSISISGGMDTRMSDESRSPSSTHRPAPSTASTNTTSITRGANSRSSSPAPSLSRNSSISGTKPSSAHPSQPLIPTSSGANSMPPSRPLVIGTTGGSMLQRHLSSSGSATTPTASSSAHLPVGSPLAAARAAHQSHHDDVVYTINARRANGESINPSPSPINSTSVPTRPSGKTYTVVRSGSNKK